MKTKPIILLLFVMFCFFSCEKNNLLELENSIVQDDQSCNNFNDSRLVTKQVYSFALKGNLLGDPELRKVTVYLPKEYFHSRGKRYPVIYYLHGQPSSETSLIDPTNFEVFKNTAGLTEGVDFPEAGFKSWMDDLIEEKGMHEAIIVMPDATNKYGFSFYSNSVLQGNYEEYIANDLVRYIDHHFRTIKDSSGRALMGHCMGGYGALRIAMKYPDIFSNVAGLSTAHFPAETVAFCAGLMPMENNMWGTVGPSSYDPSSPYKFINNTIYGLATAWLPNLDNPPYYVDIPFSYNSEGLPLLNDQLMAKWDSQSLFALMMNNPEGLKQLNTIILDCGTYDELGMTVPNQFFDQFLSETGVDHQFELYEGTHINHLYRQLQKTFVAVSQEFPETHVTHGVVK